MELTGRLTADAKVRDCAYWINPKVGQFLKKGLLVQLNGRMGSRAWVNKEGDAKSSLTANISNVKFLGSASNSTEAKPTGNKVKGAPEDDDLPF